MTDQITVTLAREDARALQRAAERTVIKYREWAKNPEAPRSERAMLAVEADELERGAQALQEASR